MTSPLKVAKPVSPAGGAKKALTFNSEIEKELGKGVLDASGRSAEMMGEIEKREEAHMNSTMHIDGVMKNSVVLEEVKEQQKKNSGTFKRMPRVAPLDSAPVGGDEQDGRKRWRREEDDMDVEENRKTKCSRDDGALFNQFEAGPADRLCG